MLPNRLPGTEGRCEVGKKACLTAGRGTQFGRVARCLTRLPPPNLRTASVAAPAGGGLLSSRIRSPYTRLRIPMIVITRSDGSRPPVPIDRDQCDGYRQVHFLISVFAFGVKCDGGRPRSQQEGPARAAEWPRWLTQRRARECLLTHGGGRHGESAPHFFAPLGQLRSAAIVATGGVGVSLASPALSLRIDGPSSSSR
jgi:hypothetical protein